MSQNVSSKYTMDLTEGSILKKLLLFSLPLMASNVLQLFFNAADIIVVGQFAGDNSLAAVGSTSSVIHLLTNVFMGLSVGVNVLVAHHFAAKQEDELRKTIHTAITISLLCGIIMILIGELAAEQVLKMMDTPAEVLDLAVLYLRVYFLGMPATVLYNFGAAILRAIGDTKRPLYFLTFAGLVNLVLNCVFVIVFHMDVAGVAIATVIAQCISALLVLRCLVNEAEPIHLTRRGLGIDRGILVKIIQIGLPAGIQSSLFSLSNVVIQSSINGFGSLVMAGNSAASNLEGFLNVMVTAFSQGGVAFVSQNIGAKKYERINKIVITLLLCVLVTGIVFGNVIYALGEPLLRLYTDSQDVVAAGMKRMMYASCFYFLFGMMDSMVAVMRGMGRSVAPMIVALLGVCGFRLLWIAVMFSNPAFHAIETVYIAYPLSWGLTFIVHTICFIFVRRGFKAKWGI